MKKPTHYYEWGNEQAGYVSTYYWDENDVLRHCEDIPKEDARALGLKFNCPFP